MLTVMRFIPTTLWILLLFLTQGEARGGVSPSPAAPDAKAVESHLIAPCCWRETLDVHQSPLATELRREISERLANGESAAAIEESLVTRYGPKLRANLPDKLGYLVVGLATVGGFLAFMWLRMRRRTAVPREPVEVPKNVLSDADRQRFEDQLGIVKK